MSHSDTRCVPQCHVSSVTEERICHKIMSIILLHPYLSMLLSLAAPGRPSDNNMGAFV